MTPAGAAGRTLRHARAVRFCHGSTRLATIPARYTKNAWFATARCAGDALPWCRGHSVASLARRARHALKAGVATTRIAVNAPGDNNMTRAYLLSCSHLRLTREGHIATCSAPTITRTSNDKHTHISLPHDRCSSSSSPPSIPCNTTFLLSALHHCLLACSSCPCFLACMHIIHTAAPQHSPLHYLWPAFLPLHCLNLLHVSLTKTSSLGMPVLMRRGGGALLLAPFYSTRHLS